MLLADGGALDNNSEGKREEFVCVWGGGGKRKRKTRDKYINRYREKER